MKKDYGEKLTLLIDAPNLLYTSFYGYKKSSCVEDIENKNFMLYGILNKLLIITNGRPIKKVVFCFDSKFLYRKECYPMYKSNRVHDKVLKKQIVNVKKDLRNMGFINVFQKHGYEADDLIAHLALLESVKPSLIVSSDQDFYQCLTRNCSIYNIRKNIVFKRRHFKTKYNIEARLWHETKAIAGCSSDNVKGVSGIGEKRAINYLSGNASENVVRKIQNNKKLIDFNRTLVELPFSKDINIEIKNDKVSFKKIKLVLKKYKFFTLIDKYRIGAGRKLIGELTNQI